MTRNDGPPARSERLGRAVWLLGDPEIIDTLRQAREDWARASQRLTDHYRIEHGHPPSSDSELFRGKLWVSDGAQDGHPLALALLDAVDRRKTAKRRLEDDLRARLKDGRLVAWGRVSLEWDSWQQIPPAAMSRLDIVDLELGVVRDRLDPRRSYSDVHLLDARPDDRKQFTLITEWFEELPAEQQEDWRARLVGCKKQRGVWQEAANTIRACYPHHKIRDPERVLRTVLRSLGKPIPEK